MASGQPPPASRARTRLTSASPGLVFVTAAIAFLIVLAAIGWGIYEVYQIGHPAVKK